MDSPDGRGIDSSKTRGKDRLALLCCLVLVGTTMLSLPGAGEATVLADKWVGLLEMIRLTPEDLRDGFVVESEFELEAPDDLGIEIASGRLFLLELREGASVVLAVNLYILSSSEEAGEFFDLMMEGDTASSELAVGEQAMGRSQDATTWSREALPVCALLFRRDCVVAFLTSGSLDGHAVDGEYLRRDEVLDLEGLLAIASVQDRKIVEVVGR